MLEYCVQFLKLKSMCSFGYRALSLQGDHEDSSNTVIITKILSVFKKENHIAIFIRELEMLQLSTFDIVKILCLV